MKEAREGRSFSRAKEVFALRKAPGHKVKVGGTLITASRGQGCGNKEARDAQDSNGV